MSRGSSLPCPGCGKVKSYRKSTEVCRECGALLRKAKWLEEQLAKLEGDEIIVSYGTYAHWNEYIYSHAGIGRDLMGAVFDIAEAASRPAMEYNSEFPLLGKIEPGGTTYAVMPRPLAEAIRDLYAMLGPSLKAEYEKGKKDGRNLLMRLANGDIAPNEFFEKEKAA